MKLNRDLYHVKIRKDYNKKNKLKKKSKRSAPRKYSRIIDEVNSIK